MPVTLLARLPAPVLGHRAGVQLPGPAPCRADTKQHLHQRAPSMAQRALRFPGFGLFGGNSSGGGHDSGSSTGGRGTSGSSTSGDRGSSSSSTVAAAANSKGGGASSAPDDSPRPAHVSDGNGLTKKGVDSSSEAIYEMAAAVAAASNGNNGYQMNGQRPTVNGHVNGHASRHAQHSDVKLGAVGGAAVAEPMRVENNIAPYKDASMTPYVSGVPSLAGQIREIASTLRHINTLRVEYLDKIAHQELELETKDQALRSKEDRIHSLESEMLDLRKSLALLHSAKVAAETEVQRLRASASAAAALPAPAATPALEPPAPAASTPTLAPAAAAAPAVPAASAPAAPARVAEPAPAAVAAAAAAPAAPPTPAPPPPPPPRVPEIQLSYRSSWGEVFLHVNVDGKGWTVLPGLRMEHNGNKEHSLTLQGRSIEFVLNNGRGEWDSPNGAGAGKNYRIGTAGEYRLHNGALVQVKAWQQ
ncbi:hypothetical protein TSOC_002568 [Tetrabaena socialis]|uniref:Carbohydrate binding module family 25 domain-containing protein n=1 Tax=Tetrabaena socialis TaxID=47790 RepID=A0A2J8ADV4_9CHLO|nr:hypothetical protein TSOC_002568 [Tetrabaena socialis]|eukprot:PNH10693.1 hypothetical protein TSOC_002568 [Tetrabaena socialis]